MTPKQIARKVALEKKVKGGENLSAAQTSELKELRNLEHAAEIDRSLQQIEEPLIRPAAGTDLQTLRRTIEKAPSLVGSQYRIANEWTNVDFRDDDNYAEIPIAAWEAGDYSQRKQKEFFYSKLQPLEAFYLAKTGRLPQVLERMSEEEAAAFYSHKIAEKLVKENARLIEAARQHEQEFEPQLKVQNDFHLPT